MNELPTNSVLTTVLKYKQQLLVGVLLALAMILTRGHITAHLQDASWAIFFLVGFYLRDSRLSRYTFPAFFLLAFIIDLIVIDAQGGTHYCFTPSYPFLIPSYAAMWFAGRWFANNAEENILGLTKLVSAAFIGTLVCFAISNISFYYFAGKFETMSLMEYSQAVSKYLPAYLTTTGLYIGFVAIVHLVIGHSRKLDQHAHS